MEEKAIKRIAKFFGVFFPSPETDLAYSSLNKQTSKYNHTLVLFISSSLYEEVYHTQSWP